MTFNEVLPSLVRICENAPGFASLPLCCVVRDLRGRVRLFLQQIDPPPPGLNLHQLEQDLSTELEEYFVPPIRCSSGEGDEGRLTRKLLGQARSDPPWNAEYLDLVTGRTVAAGGGRWRKIEAQLSKEYWLQQTSAPPWPLSPDKPPIVTFYSFKGGAGRTTALAACAWQLARMGKKVTVIDLDLEAPGIGAVLGAAPKRGAIDFLIDEIARGNRKTDLDAAYDEAREFGPTDGKLVQVVPAGVLDENYLQKLARLDFVVSSPWRAPASPRTSPVEDALKLLLHRVLQRLRPDFIFIDSRAGLHDLAGLSLHGVAHIDVIISRASAQALKGLDLTLRTLKKKRGADPACILVHSFAPKNDATPEAVREKEHFRQRSYEICCETLYGPTQPPYASPDSTHWPVTLRHDERLERFDSLQGIEAAFFEKQYEDLVARIRKLSRR